MCVVVVGPLKAQLVLFRFASERRVSRMSCTSSPAWKWKRGPLAPVVVVGEGQVNLVFRPAVEPAGAMVKVSKALWLMMNQIDQSSGCDSSCVSSPELA